MIDGHGVNIDFKNLKPDPYVYFYLEGGVVVTLTLYVDGVLLFGRDLRVLLIGKSKQNLLGYLSVTGMKDASLVLRIGVTRDHTKETATITQNSYTNYLLERYGKTSWNPAYILGVRTKPKLDQSKEELLNKEDKKRFQTLPGSVMYLRQVIRDDILYAVNQLARVVPKPSKGNQAPTPLPGRDDELRHHFQPSVFKLTAFSDSNWNNNLDNGKSTSSYTVIISNTPVSFKVGLQGPTVHVHD